MPKVLKILDLNRCINCYGCMLACSRTWHKSFSLERSAIQIGTAGGLRGQMMAVFCQGCLNPPCIQHCPSEALKAREGGGIVYDRKKCTGCRDCVKDCPICALSWDDELGELILCRYCGACARFCPHDVIGLREVEKT